MGWVLKSRAKLNAEIEAGEPAKKERDAKTAAAQAEVDAASSAYSASKEAYDNAVKAVSGGTQAAKDKKKQASSWLLDLKRMYEELDAASVELSEFKDGPMAAFLELKAAPTPSAEPQRMEEPAVE